MFTTAVSENRIDPAEIHDILRNDRRRQVLQYLKQRLEPVSLRALSERIAEREASESPAPRNVRQSVYNSLHQTHLPKLEDAGIVEYDEDRKRVRLRESAQDINAYMDVVTPLGISWVVYYRSLGVLALSVILLSAIDIWVFSSLEPLFFATVFLFAYALSTGYQVWTRRWFYLRALVGGS